MEESFRSTMQKENKRLKNVSKNGVSIEERQAVTVPLGVDEANSAGGFGLQPLQSKSRLSQFQQIRKAAQETMANLQEGKDFDSARKELESGRISETMNEILAISSDINTT